MLYYFCFILFCNYVASPTFNLEKESKALYFKRNTRAVLTATEGNTTTKHTKANLLGAMTDGVTNSGSYALYIPYNSRKGRHITCHWYHCTLINFIIENHNSLFVSPGNRYPPCSAWFVSHEYSWVLIGDLRLLLN